MSQVEFVLVLLGGAVLLMIFIWMGVALYLGYAKIDVIMSHLENSSSATALTYYRSLGAWGRVYFISRVAEIVAFPSDFIKRGSLSVEDLNGLPVSLRNTLVIWRWGVLVLFALLLLLGGVSEVIDWGARPQT